jgi:hypothetical protein
MHPLKKALNDRRAADQAIEAALKKHFPVDKYIKWTANAGREYYGNVVRHGYGDRIEVRNAETNKARWISACQIAGPLSDTHRPEEK